MEMDQKPCSSGFHSFSSTQSNSTNCTGCNILLAENSKLKVQLEVFKSKMIKYIQEADETRRIPSKHQMVLDNMQKLIGEQTEVKINPMVTSMSNDFSTVTSSQIGWNVHMTSKIMDRRLEHNLRTSVSNDTESVLSSDDEDDWRKKGVITSRIRMPNRFVHRVKTERQNRWNYDPKGLHPKTRRK